MTFVKTLSRGEMKKLMAGSSSDPNCYCCPDWGCECYDYDGNSPPTGYSWATCRWYNSPNTGENGPQSRNIE